MQRRIEVLISASVAQYRAGVRAATADTTALNAATTKAQAGATGMGASMQRAGTAAASAATGLTRATTAATSNATATARASTGATGMGAAFTRSGAAASAAAAGITRATGAASSSAAALAGTTAAATTTATALARAGTAATAAAGGITRAGTAAASSGTSAAAAATGWARLGTAAAAASTRVAAAGASATRAGKAIAGFSTAIGLAAAGAAFTAGQYEREFSKIEGLVGVARDEVQGMAADTLALAGATARAPQELASAMFTIQSAGLRGAQGTAALEMAARGAAAGMGETRDIAQAMTSILSAYASTNITAAEAADVLAATVRAGNFEASQLAGSIGRILPIASTLGIAIEDVGGGIALLTRNNGNATESITALRGVMNALLNPSSEAARILNNVGTSSAELRAIAAGPQGLVGAIQHLDTALGGNTEQMAKVLGRTEALGAALTILDADADTIAATFGEVADATGTMDEAFDAAAATSAFKFEQAMTRLKVAGIEIGGSVLPLVAGAAATVAAAVGAAAEVFTSLPGPVRTATAALALLAAAAAPILITFGKIANGAIAVSGAVTSMASRFAASSLVMNRFGGSVAAAAGALGLAAAAIGLAAIAYTRHQQQAAEARRRQDDLNAALLEVGDPARAAQQRLEDVANALADLSAEAPQAGEAVGTALEEWAAGILEAENVASTLDTIGLSMADAYDLTREFASSDVFGQLKEQFVELGVSAARGQDITNVLERIQSTAASAGPEVGQFTDRLLAFVDAGAITGAEASKLAGAFDELASLQQGAFDQAQAAAVGFINTMEAIPPTMRASLAAQAEAATTTDELAAAQERAATIGQLLIDAEDGIATSAAGAANAQRIAAEAAAEAATAADQKRAANAALTAELAPLNGLLGAIAGQYSTLAGGIAAATSSAAAFIASQRSVISSVNETHASFSAAIDAMSAYRNMLAGINSQQKTLDDTTIAVVNAEKQFVAALDASNGSLDVRDETGQRAFQTTRALLEAERDHTLALIANGASAAEASARQADLETAYRSTLTAAGATKEQVDSLIGTYLEIPDAVITQLVAETAEAEASTERLIELAERYGTIDVQALLRLDAAEAEATIIRNIAELQGIDSTTYRAALDVDSTGFDTTFAAVILQLAGYTETEARATLAADPSEAHAAIREATQQLDVYGALTATATATVDTTRAVAGFDLSTAAGRQFAEANYIAAPTVDQTGVTSGAAAARAVLASAAAGPYTADIAARAIGAALAASQIDAAAGQRNAIIRAEADVSAAIAALNAAAADRTTTIRVNTINTETFVGQVSGPGQSGGASGGTTSNPAPARPAVVGGSFGLTAGRFFADGGITRSAAHPTAPDRPHTAHIAPAGTWRIFAEPETGGEAYIPLAPGKRHQSTAILSQVADMFGLRVDRSEQYNNGGFHRTAAPVVTNRAATTINVNAGAITIPVTAGDIATATEVRELVGATVSGAIADLTDRIAEETRTR